MKATRTRSVWLAAVCASAVLIAAPTGSAALTLAAATYNYSDDAGFPDARSLVEELQTRDDSIHDSADVTETRAMSLLPRSRREERALEESNGEVRSGSFSTDASTDPQPQASPAAVAAQSPSPVPVPAPNTTSPPPNEVEVTPTPATAIPAPSPTVPAPVPTIPTPPPTPEPTPTPAPETPAPVTPTPAPETLTPVTPTPTPEPLSPEPTPNPATPSPSPESLTPDPTEIRTPAPSPSSTPPQDNTANGTPAPRTTTPAPTPKPNLIFDIKTTDEDKPAKKYARNSDTTTGSTESSGAGAATADQEDRSSGDGSNGETSATTKQEEKVIGGKSRGNPVNAVAMSQTLAEFHNVVRYATCTFAGISVALLLFFHYASLDPNVDWSSALLWSPNTWEFVLYLGYLQQMGSLSQLNLLSTPYFLWDFTDSFSWSLFLINRSGAAAATSSRRLDAVVVTGVVAYGDRIGIEETSLLFICSLAFLLVFGILFAVYVALVLFAKRKAEDKFDAIVDNYSVIDPSGARDAVFGLRLVSLRFLGLCMLIWLFALYPLSLFASFEISMQIDSASASIGSLILAIVVLGVVCFGVLFLSAKELYNKSEGELADVKNLALWGSLYAAYTYRRRLFFLVVAFVQIGSGVLIGAMTTAGSPTALLVMVLVLQIAYLGAVFFQAGFISLSVGLFTFALSFVKIVNYALAFAFLEATNQSSGVRTRVATAFIFINSIVLIAWFVRHAIMFVQTLRALARRDPDAHASGGNNRRQRQQQQSQYRHGDDEDDDELLPEMVEFQTPVERDNAGAGNNSNGSIILEAKTSNLSDSSRGSNVYVTMVVSPARERDPSRHSDGDSSCSGTPPRGTVKIAL